MAAVIKRSGRYNYRVKEHTPQKCVIEFLERWGDQWDVIGTSEFTIEDARKAGTQNIDKFPRNMLFARAMSNGVRWYCPDIFLGAPVYTPEELGVEVSEDGEVIEVDSTTEPVELTPLQRVEAIASLLQVEVEAWLDTTVEATPSYASATIREMCIGWAENEGYHRSHAQNSFQKHVPEFLSRGMSEAMSVAAWMEHIKASVR